MRGRQAAARSIPEERLVGVTKSICLLVIEKRMVIITTN